MSRRNSRRPPGSHGPRRELLDDPSLFEAVTGEDRLETAWGKVWSNAGAAGGDNVSVRAFFRMAPRRLAGLRHALIKGTYAPGPIRRIEIPKPHGGTRPLAIPCVIDRIAQTAAADVLGPLLDQEFEDASFGYRKGRSVQQAVAQVAAAGEAGYQWVVDADIKRYFENIPHDGLMERWAQSLSDGPLTELVRTWITAAEPDGRGVAQGSPLSPLLSNLYLDRLDEQFQARDIRLVRFADDFVLLCRSQGDANAAMAKVERLLAEFGLELNREKTKIIDFNRGFRFLGHLFVRSMTLKSAPDRPAPSQFDQAMRALAEADDAARAEAATEAAEEARAEALGYAPGLRILHLRTPDRRLNVRNQAFVVEEGRGVPGETVQWRELLAIPHQQVDRIDLGTEAVATEAGVRHALATDTPLAYVDGHGATVGWTSQALAPRAERHLAQARVALDPAARLELARSFVTARVRNQRAVLRRLLQGRDTPPRRVTEALVVLNRIIGRGENSVLAQAGEIETLMGREGQAAAAWWPAIGVLAHPDFALNRRQRRNADAPNICLNFFAWLLTRDIAVAVQRAGLHPGFGVLHAVSDRRDACVYDLMEEFRAHLIGGLFVYCTNRRLVRPEMFESRAGGVRMAREGGNALIRAYESRVNGKVTSPRSRKRVTWRRLMVEQALALAAHVEGRAVYTPYNMDY